MGIRDEKYKCRNFRFYGTTQDIGEQTLQEWACRIFLSVHFMHISYVSPSRSLLPNDILTLSDIAYVRDF